MVTSGLDNSLQFVQLDLNKNFDNKKLPFVREFFVSGFKSQKGQRSRMW